MKCMKLFKREIFREPRIIVYSGFIVCHMVNMNHKLYRFNLIKWQLIQLNSEIIKLEWLFNLKFSCQFCCSISDILVEKSFSSIYAR